MNNEKFNSVISALTIACLTTSCSFSLGSMVGASSQILFPITLAAAAGTPLILKGFQTLVAKEEKDEYLHHVYMLQYLGIFKDDLYNKNKNHSIITGNTKYFINFYYKYFDGNINNQILELDKDCMENINQFLYLINCNYYLEISAKDPTIQREDLLNQFISEIISYFAVTKKRDFTDYDAKVILSHCSFLSLDLKRRIYKEFRGGKISFPNSTNKYAIVPFRETFTKSDNYDFDFDDRKSYYDLIDKLFKIKYFARFGNVGKINLDIDFLDEMMHTLINNYQDELLEINSDYCNFELIVSFLIALLIYGAVNKIDNIGSSEMITVLRNWEYLPSDNFVLEMKGKVKEKTRMF